MLTIRHVAPDGVRTIGRDELDAAVAADGFVWIDLTAPTDAEEEVLEQIGLPPGVVEDMRDDRHLPKVEVMAGVLSLTVHGLDVRSLDDELRTVELDIALGERLLVTFHEGGLASVEAVGDRVDDGTIQFTRPFVLVHRLLDVMNDVFVPLVDHLDRRLDVIEDDLLDQPTDRTRLDLYALQRDVIQLRRVVVPQAEVVRRLIRLQPPGFEAGDESLVRDLHDHLYRMVAMSDSYHQLLDSAMATYRSSLDDRLNDMLATLTIVSAVLLPVSVVAGLWGMNFAHVPGSEVRAGFWWVIGGSIGVIGLMLVWFASRGWIGGFAERRAAKRRRSLGSVLEVPVLGQILRIPVAGGRAVSRAVGRRR